MKITAAVFRSPHRPFCIETLDLDDPHAGELLVRVTAAGVCHSDWNLVTGDTCYPTPVVPGHEGAGIVEAVGEGVSRVRVGDQVAFCWAPSCGTCFYCLRGRPSLCSTYLMANWAGTLLDGTTRLSIDGKPVYHFSTVACFADRTVVPEQCCVPIRKEVPAVIAALLGCAVTTGVGAVLNTARIQPGSSVVVAGVGGVGASIILAARLSGAVPIVAVDTTEEKAAAALDLGASEAFVAGEGVPPRIRALTGGRGADYVFDATGLPSVQEQCLDCIRPGGTIVLVGISPVGSSTNFPGAILTRREITVMGSYYGTSNPARDFPLYADLYLERKLDLDRLVTRTFSLSQINEAYAEMVGGKTVRGVIVF